MRFSGISTSAPNGVGSLGLNWTGLCWTPGGGGGAAGAEAGVIIKQHRRSLLEKRVFLANLCGSAA